MSGEDSLRTAAGAVLSAAAGGTLQQHEEQGWLQQVDAADLDLQRIDDDPALTHYNPGRQAPPSVPDATAHVEERQAATAQLPQGNPQEDEALQEHQTAGEEAHRAQQLVLAQEELALPPLQPAAPRCQ